MDSKIKHIQKILWFLPFITFMLGYYLTEYFFTTSELDVPTVIGKTLSEGSKIISDYNLNCKILSQKEDPDLPDGTILEQMPINQKVKPNQSVYLTISKQLKKMTTPQFKDKNLDEINNIITRSGFKVKIYYLDSNIKENQCISQFPENGTLIDKNEKIIIYLSNGLKKPILIPNFKGLNLKEVVNFLHLNNISSTVYPEQKQNKEYIIIDQRPLPGSIMQPSHKINIQLQIEEAY